MEDKAPAFRRAALAAAAGCLLFALWLHGLWGGELAVLWMENLALVAAPLLAALACASAARRARGSARTGWTLLCAAAASWAFGSAVVTWVFNVRQAGLPVAERTIAVPGLADAGFLLFFPLAILGLLEMSQGRFLVQSRLRTALDGLVIVACVLFVAWAFGVGENLESLGAEALRPDLCGALGPRLCATAGWVLGVANPLGDVLLASVAFLVASFAPRVDARTLGLLVAGFLAVTVADIDFSTRWLRADTSVGNLLDTGWVAGFSFVALAALRPASPPAGPETVRPTRALALLPYIPVALAAAVAAAVQVRDGGLDPFLFWTAFATVGLVMARQAALVSANLRLRRETEASYARLKESEALRSSLLHAITHDLQNPLSPIQLHLSLLGGHGALGPEERQRVAVVQRNVDQVVRLTGDLADVAKLQDGRLRLDAQPMDVRDVLRDVVASFGPLAAGRGLSLAEDAPEPLPAVADAGRLRQVVANLVSNALRFTREGGVAVAGRREGDRVVVRVRDTGRGLEPEEAARLFRPFSQVHAPGEAHGRGTGLGLFISKGLVERHGGGVAVRSGGRGKGSEFSFWVPAAGPAQA